MQRQVPKEAHRLKATIPRIPKASKEARNSKDSKKARKRFFLVGDSARSGLASKGFFQVDTNDRR